MNARPDRPPPYGTVVFDCDSTLSRIEGIEELAHACRERVQELTRRAMDGELPLEETYGARLELIAPSRHDLQRVGGLYFSERMPHALELVQALRSLGKRVLIVSGGLLPAVASFARALGLDPRSDVHAVPLQFDDAGAYAGFDEASPLARSGGKIAILRSIAAADAGAGVVFIGDGVTDLEAAPEVQRFIGYGGVTARARVMRGAQVTSTASDLAALVPLLFSREECERLHSAGSHSSLLDAAASTT